MYKMVVGGGGMADEADGLGYVEIDPSGRYGRFREILGKGAVKTVYRAFDEVLGMEVAWNQVQLKDVFQSPDQLQRLYYEVHLLNNLDHESIMRFHTSWIDIHRRTFNFIAEMFTSGTLREYRKKNKRVDIRAVKNWARQILRGLVYLHGHDPPVIHRDLKCDNIFVNGHLGQVKIGDLGLAAILRGSQRAHSVIGTPEFMAPELYEEEYNELVDIYSFGMCMLEMLTSEYPYSECSNPAQIYKKVTSGKLPEAFHRIQDKEAKQFVGKCLENVSKRLPARELLLDPFLASETDGELLPNLPRNSFQTSVPSRTMLVKTSPVGDLLKNTDMIITGTMNPEDDTIFDLKVQITDKDGHSRNIFFPFDTAKDTAIGVATEMVKELEISDWEPSKISEMIEDEICSILPSWKEGSSPKFLDPHSFSFKEDNDDVAHHLFYCNSSYSSSTSLQTFNALNDTECCLRRDATLIYDGLQENLFMGDDASSQSSMTSFKYSNISYHSGNEDDCESSSRGGEPLCISECQICPTHRMNTDHNRQPEVIFDFERHIHGSNNPQRIGRIKSLVDIRRQQLRRSLFAEISKRRLFKTVGAVENIGFTEPREEFSGKTHVKKHGFY